MFKKDSKYRFHFMITMFVLLVLITVFNFIDFYEKKDGMKRIGGIVFGFMSVFYAFDLYDYLKNKKRINS
jgi:hypothetical protein